MLCTRYHTSSPNKHAGLTTALISTPGLVKSGKTISQALWLALLLSLIDEQSRWSSPIQITRTWLNNAVLTFQSSGLIFIVCIIERTRSLHYTRRESPLPTILSVAGWVCSGMRNLVRGLIFTAEFIGVYCMGRTQHYVTSVRQMIDAWLRSHCRCSRHYKPWHDASDFSLCPFGLTHWGRD